jgi:hypothetical protein
MKMKAVYIVIAISLLYNTVSQGQISIEEHQLPEAVQRYFPVVYPLDEAVVVHWTLEDSLYYAKFKVEEYPVEVIFKANGFWVNTFWQIQYQFVPEKIASHINSHAPGSTVEMCLISNNPFNERYYIITLIPADGNSEPETLYFTLDGKFSEK